MDLCVVGLTGWVLLMGRRIIRPPGRRPADGRKGRCLCGALFWEIVGRRTVLAEKTVAQVSACESIAPGEIASLHGQ